MRWIASLITICFFVQLCLGAVINIPTDQPTIQAGIDAATEGDTVLVTPGTYVEIITYPSHSLALCSSDGAETTFLQHPGVDRSLILISDSDSGSVFSGFTINNVSNGPYVIHAEGRVESFEIRNNRFADITVVDIIRGRSMASLDISRNLFSTSVTGNIVVTQAQNCAFVNNTVDGGHRGLAIYGRNSTIINNILVNLTDYAIEAPHLTSSVDYNNIWNNGRNDDPGPNGMSADPMFSDPGSYDYDLQPESPCIDAGHPDPEHYDPRGSRNDMGAFPSERMYPVAMSFAYNPSAEVNVVLSATPEVFWCYLDTGPTSQTHFEIEVGTDGEWSTAEMWSSGERQSPDTCVAYDGIPLLDFTKYYLRIRVNGGGGWGDWTEETFYVRLTNVIRVPEDVSSLDEAMNFPIDGDTVMVGPGEYSANIDFRGRGFVLTSTHGQDSTCIEAANPYRSIVAFVSGEDTTSVIEGFSIRHTTDAVGVICSRSNPIVQSCDVYYCNHTGDGAAIHCEGSGARIRNNQIHDNYSARTGGGILATGVSDDTLEIISNKVYNNTGQDGSGIGCGSSSWNIAVERNVIWGNVGAGTSAAGIYVSGDHIKIVNNTVVGNSRGIVAYRGCCSVEIINNAVISNTREGLVPHGSSFDYNNVWNNGSHNDPGPNGISADPMFKDSVNHIYELVHGSPCINRGNPEPRYEDFDQTRNDIGAFPLLLEMPIAASINFGPMASGGVVFSDVPKIFWSYRDTVASSQSMFELEVGTDSNWETAELWSSGQVQSADTSVVYGGPKLANMTKTYYRIRLNDGHKWGAWRSSHFRVRLSTLIGVPGDQETIQEAIEFTVDGDTILVAEGIFADEGNYDIDFEGRNVVLKSESGSRWTVIDCGLNGRGFHFHNAESLASVEGFTIINGIGLGSGMFCTGSSPTIVDCHFAFNQTTSTPGTQDSHPGSEALPLDLSDIWEFEPCDAGVFCYSSKPVFKNCVFSGHVSTETDPSAAVYIEGGTALFEDCLFEENHGVWASALYTIFTVVGLNDCTFTDNTADVATVFVAYGIFTAENCLFHSSRSRSERGGIIVAALNRSVRLLSCDFVANAGSLLYPIADGHISVEMTNMVFGTGSHPIVATSGYDEIPYIECSNIYGNEGGDWTGLIADYGGIMGNISADPVFCDPIGGDFRVIDTSQCARSNNSCRTLIGSFGIGCFAEEPVVLPKSFKLHQNFPNPFNAATTIRYDLPEESKVKISVHNILGRCVITLVDRDQLPGYHETVWHGTNSQGEQTASGIYFYKIEAGTFASTKKMVMLK